MFALVVRVGEASVPTREFYTALGNQYGMTGVTMMTYGKTEKEDKVWCECGIYKFTKVILNENR